MFITTNSDKIQQGGSGIYFDTINNKVNFYKNGNEIEPKPGIITNIDSTDIKLGVSTIEPYSAQTTLSEVLTDYSNNINNINNNINEYSLPTDTVIETFNSGTISFNNENTIYKITGNVKLTSNTTIPSGCTLWFTNDGKIIVDSGSRYTLTGTNTNVIAGWNEIFDINVNIAGTWNCTARPDWFGAKSNRTDYGSWSTIYYGNRDNNVSSTSTGTLNNVEVACPNYCIDEELIGATGTPGRDLTGEFRPVHVTYLSKLKKFAIKQGSTYYAKWKNSNLWNDPKTGLARTDTVYICITDPKNAYDKNELGVSIIFKRNNNTIEEQNWKTQYNGVNDLVSINKAISMADKIEFKPNGCYFIKPINTSMLNLTNINNKTFIGNAATLFLQPTKNVNYLYINSSNNITFENLRFTTIRELYTSGYGGSSYRSLNCATSNLDGIIHNSTNITFNHIETINLGRFLDIKMVSGNYKYSNNIKILNSSIKDCEQPFYISAAEYVLIDNCYINILAYNSPGAHIVYHAGVAISDKIASKVHIKNSNIETPSDGSIVCAINGNTDQKFMIGRHTILLDYCNVKCSGRLAQLGKGHSIVIKNSYIDQFTYKGPALKWGSWSESQKQTLSGKGSFYIYDSTVSSSGNGTIYKGDVYEKCLFYAERTKFYTQNNSTSGGDALIIGYGTIELHNCGAITAMKKFVIIYSEIKLIIDNCYINCTLRDETNSTQTPQECYLAHISRTNNIDKNLDNCIINNNYIRCNGGLLVYFGTSATNLGLGNAIITNNIIGSGILKNNVFTKNGKFYIISSTEKFGGKLQNNKLVELSNSYDITNPSDLTL